MQVRPWVLLLLTSAILTSTAIAQSPVGPQPPSGGQPSSGPPVVNFSDGGASVSGNVMESIVITPKANAPFNLMLAAEWSHPLATGGTFTLANERRIARDSKGRIYQERWLLVPKGGDIKSEMNVFQLTDPERHTWYNCWTRKKVCDLFKYSDTTQATYQPRIGRSGPLPDGRGFTQADDLGEGSLAGLETHGYRETVTFNPGTMGNDQPMIATREFWFSPQLAINLSSIVDNPQTGKQVFTVKDLSTSEPDPSLFAVPADYRVVDRRNETDPPVSYPIRR
jgi:hypothetical protein